MKYYLHQDTGFYDAYFGNIGEPIEVSYIRYLVGKCQGLVATKSISCMPIEDVHVQAQIEAGSHPTSYKVEKLREAYATRRKELALDNEA